MDQDCLFQSSSLEILFKTRVQLQCVHRIESMQLYLPLTNRTRVEKDLGLSSSMFLKFKVVSFGGIFEDDECHCANEKIFFEHTTHLFEQGLQVTITFVLHIQIIKNKD